MLHKRIYSTQHVGGTILRSSFGEKKKREKHTDLTGQKRLLISVKKSIQAYWGIRKNAVPLFCGGKRAQQQPNKEE